MANAFDDYSWAYWPPSTEITLTNVPWNNDYRDVWQPKPGARTINQYISGKKGNWNQVATTYHRPMLPVRLDIPINKGMTYNYVRVHNPLMNDKNDVPQDYYYFITDVRWIAEGTTEFVLQLDVWQTFHQRVTWGNGYLERGHIGIAHDKQFDNYGRDYLTTPEGFDTGGEMRVVARRRRKLFQLNSGVTNGDILVVTTVSLEADPGTLAKPRVNTARGDQMQGLPSGAEYYIFESIADLKSFMFKFRDKPWVTQGIISITLIPEVTRYGYTKEKVSDIAGVNVYKIDMAGQKNGLGAYEGMFDNWRESEEIYGDIPERYRHLRKFWTFPYLLIEMTTWTAQPLILKPESWAQDNAAISEKASFVPPSQRVTFFPWKYNANPSAEPDTQERDGKMDYYDDKGEYLDMSTSISNFPTFAVVNNMALSTLASNRNANQFAWKQADWSQQRALGSAQTSYDQASGGINTSNELARLSQNADIMGTMQNNSTAGMRALQSGANSVVNGVTSFASGPAAGIAGTGAGLLGAANAALGYTIETNQSNAMLSIRNSAAVNSQSASSQNAAMVRDTNKSLADWAAKGDYAINIAGLQAKIQDTYMTQPATSGQVGGEAFNIIHSASELSLRWKMISPNEQRSIGDYWLRYGYAMRQFIRIPQNLHVMENFTYWKLSETYITEGNMPEPFKLSLRGLLEKGVTVWADPDNIGKISIADNKPLSGIKLNIVD